MMLAEPITQSCRVSATIWRMVATPRPGSPTSHASAPWNSTSALALLQSPSLSFRRWMRIALRVAVGREARQQEARQPALRLREHEERVAHRRREEPLVPDELVELPASSRTDWRGARGVRAHVGAALLLGHPHADRVARPCPTPAPTAGRTSARGRAAASPSPAPAACSQRRHAGVRHRQRAARPLVGLVVQVRQRRARDVRALLRRVPPREARHAVLDAELHDAVVGGMELHLVDAVAEPVVRAELGRMRVGLGAERHQLAAGDDAVRRDLRLGPHRRLRAAAPRAAAGRCRTRRTARAVEAGSPRCGSGKARVS